MKYATITAVLLATALQVLDLLTFWIVVEAYGSRGESSTLMATIYDQMGMLGVTLFKAAVIAAIFIAGYFLHQRIRAFLVFSIGAIGFLGVLVNSISAVVVFT